MYAPHFLLCVSPDHKMDRSLELEPSYNLVVLSEQRDCNDKNKGGGGPLCAFHAEWLSHL